MLMIVMVDVNSLVETFSWHVLQIERSFGCCKVSKRHAVHYSQSGKKAWHLRIAGPLHFKVRQCFKKVHQWACQRLNWSTMQMLKEVLLQRQKNPTPPLPAHLHPSHRRDAINVLYWKCEACKQNTFAIILDCNLKKICTGCAI